MIRHLLVAHDLTPEADVALARAAQLARQHDARVSLLHVYDPGLSASAVKTVSAMLQLKRKEAGLDEDSAIHLFRGQPIDGILQQTRALEPDLLLMGAVARGHLDNALIGQTAERVLEEVECDLLVLKPTNDI